MGELMLSALMIALLVQAVWATMWEEAIFDFIPKAVDPVLEGAGWSKLAKPLYDCPICMTPWYGTAIYHILGSNGDPRMWILTVILAMGMNVVFIKLYPDNDGLEKDDGAGVPLPVRGDMHVRGAEDGQVQAAGPVPGPVSQRAGGEVPGEAERPETDRTDGPGTSKNDTR
jgi:hypothetical protein